MNRFTAVALSVLTAITLSGCGGDVDTVPADPTTTVAAATPSPAPAPPVTAEAEEETTVPAVEDSGSYPSTEAYLEEVMDTNDKIGDLLTLVGDVLDDTVSGALSPAEGAALLTVAAETVRTHIDFFESGTPPPIFAETEGHFLDALYFTEEGFQLTSQCISDGDPSLCDQAVVVIDRATDAWNRATAAIPSSL